MTVQDALGKLGGQEGQDGGLSTIQKLFGADSMQSMVSKLSSKGSGKQVQSWIGKGQNQPISSAEVQRAVNPAMLAQVAKQRNMSPDEVIDYVAQALPDMVDKATPDGKIPEQDPFSQNMSGMKKSLKV
jgi:uncharacterized protein YidB (DUF937 family)